MHIPSKPSPFTRAHALVAVSLIFTWWLAHIFPYYTPLIRDRIQDARQAIPRIKIEWQSPGGLRNLYDQRKLALLVEPRLIPHLTPQILQMINTVPPDWRFLYVGSEESVIMVNRSFAIKHQQAIGKLDLMVLPEPWSIASKEMAYRTLTDIRFYDEFLPGVEWILKYEYDSILCANSEVSLNEWLHWSWTGAPRTYDDHFAGNGGLSLRRVSAIREILSVQRRLNDTDPEDEWFGSRLEALPGARVASGTRNALAVEDVYIEKPMGFHVRDGGNQLSDGVWKDKDRREKIFQYCPELTIIMDMKLSRERCYGDDGDGVLHPTEEEKKETEEKAKKKQQEVEKQKKLEEEAKKNQLEEAERKQQEEEQEQQKEDGGKKEAQQIQESDEEAGYER